MTAVVTATFTVVIVACSDDDQTASDTTAATGAEQPGTTDGPDTTSTPPAAPPTTDAAMPTTDVAMPTTTPAPTAPATVPTTPSAGCGADGPPDQPVPATFDFDSSSLSGEYIEQLPPGHDGSTPYPLVLNLHGYSSPAQFQLDVASLADAPGGDTVVVITPSVPRDIPRWEARSGSDDVEFLTELLDHVTGQRCIDEARVYVTGFSNGGFMTSTLACELSDRVAAVAPVAGLVDPPDCDTERRVPVLTFHGTEDEFVAFEGGTGPAADSLPRPDDGDDAATGSTADGEDTEGVTSSELVPVPETVGAWADRYGCEGPAREPVADDVRRISYDCDGKPTVVFYRIEGGGHAWPGSEVSATIESVVGPTTFSIDASALILEFFADHPLTR